MEYYDSSSNNVSYATLFCISGVSEKMSVFDNSKAWNNTIIMKMVLSFGLGVHQGFNIALITTNTTIGSFQF